MTKVMQRCGEWGDERQISTLGIGLGRKQYKQRERSVVIGGRSHEQAGWEEQRCSAQTSACPGRLAGDSEFPIQYVALVLPECPQ